MLQGVAAEVTINTETDANRIAIDGIKEVKTSSFI
jgi:hypothetical protein